MADFKFPEETKMPSPVNPVPTTQPKSNTYSGPTAVLDNLADLMKQVELIRDKIDLKKQQMIAVVLHSKALSIEDFKSQFGAPRDDSFSKHILEEVTATRSDYSIMEVFISIPMITGMLPYPNFELVRETRENITEVLKKKEKTTPQLKKQAEAAREELEKILMYPRAYKVMKGQSLPSEGAHCTVEFVAGTKNWFPSRFAMKYVGLAKESSQKKEESE